MIRGAFALLLLLPSLAHAQDASAPPLDPADAAPSAELELVLPELAPPVVDESPRRRILEEARALDARTDYAAAAAAYERYARGCLESAIAVLAPDHPCAATANALERAFELRRALGDVDAADRAAREHVESFLYAHPRAATRIGYGRARMHVAVGDADRAEASLEELARILPDPPPAQAIVMDALRARIATLADRPRRAALYWRRVERRFERERGELRSDDAIPAGWVLEAVAEGRLIRAQGAVDRYLATRPPRPRRIDDARRWWSRTMSPWLVRARRRLLLARMELERVYELGSPRHSVIAVARIGELYGHQASLHDALALPEDEWIQTLVRDGRDRPGYDQARTHFETCVRWAAHHGVAREWSRRCERSLHALDPESFPLPSELHGAAAYLPASAARPAPMAP